MSCEITDVLSGIYLYKTDWYHADNVETMNDFLDFELTNNSEFEVLFVDGTYAEIKVIDTGKCYEVHAGGNGDSSNHKITFVEIIK